MATLTELEALVNEFQENYRNPKLDPLEFIGAYSFNSKENINAAEIKYSWPAEWPTGGRKGVYAIFAHDRLLYIGKASGQPISNRIGSYFRHSDDRTHAVPIHNWSSTPTHFVAWCVPDESFFEASALEEFLISKLGHDLPDNTRGKVT